MKRTVTLDLSRDEMAILRLCEAAAKCELLAHEARHSAVRRAVQRGLPVRLVGQFAAYSGAQVSRLTGASPPREIEYAIRVSDAD